MLLNVEFMYWLELIYDFFFSITLIAHLCLLFTAQLYASAVYADVVRMSVCLSVTLR